MPNHNQHDIFIVNIGYIFNTAFAVSVFVPCQPLKILFLQLVSFSIGILKKVGGGTYSEFRMKHEEKQMGIQYDKVLIPAFSSRSNIKYLALTEIMTPFNLAVVPAISFAALLLRTCF